MGEFCGEIYQKTGERAVMGKNFPQAIKMLDIFYNPVYWPINAAR